jgi:ribulose-phosphate 3-epimerase
LVRALRPLTKKPFHVHLMVERPLSLVEEFMECGADLVTVHVESAEAGAAIEAIRRAGKSAGLALRPDTAVAEALPYLESIDTLLLLGTMPGVKGQDLLPSACERMIQAAALRGKHGVRLVADGGIRVHTVQLLRRAGADVVVPGSLVFGSRDVAETFAWLRGL